MKVTFILVLAIQCLIISTNLALSYENEPDNFHGIKFGSDISSRSDMMPVKDKTLPVLSEEQLYIRENDVLKFGDVSLQKILYCSNKKRLRVVWVYFDGKDKGNCHWILRELKRLYGPPDKVSTQIHTIG